MAVAWQEEWRCGQPIDISAELVEAVGSIEGFIGRAGSDRTRPFLVGRFAAPDLGSILFVKQSSGWRAFPIEDGGAIQGAFASAATGGVVIFSMLSREGPGSSFVTVASSDGLANLSCGEVAFPGELNHPNFALEFLVLKDFNGDDAGTGALVGAAEVMRDNVDQTWWYRYETKDGGISWSGPSRLPGEPAELAGVFQPVGEAPGDLVDDLKAAASGR